ncbi:MAG: LytTR family DNA-binding domain-containing protein [Chitinophagaceae bacterium]
MDQINAFIVDDEPSSIRVFTKLLNTYCPDVNIVNTASSVAEAHEKLLLEKPDVLFLDIQMPIENGFDLLNRIAPYDFEIVFVTAFDNYAIKAIRLDAFDYILKPVSIDALRDCIKRLKTKRQEKVLKAPSTEKKQPEISLKTTRVSLPTINGFAFFETAEIISCEASGGYTKLNLLHKKNVLISQHLKELEQQLPTNIFFRVHHSFLINLNCIKTYTKGRGGYVEMIDGTIIEVAARRKEAFLSRFKQS